MLKGHVMHDKTRGKRGSIISLKIPTTIHRRKTDGADRWRKTGGRSSQQPASIELPLPVDLRGKENQKKGDPDLLKNRGMPT